MGTELGGDEGAGGGCGQVPAAAPPGPRGRMSFGAGAAGGAGAWSGTGPGQVGITGDRLRRLSLGPCDQPRVVMEHFGASPGLQVGTWGATGCCA
ncbi:uncharacterized protein LOC131591015 isoform X3 [Poecile atricapillus]|uniref:uncharacterized protein LOC131591015 isoform X3 n=1 Tax=Poecile atricapillus TaxID=48891 RepID=UPI002738C3B0|nr:uncharacterized protein LOC131591015 isoform X3 [Poecile atricapillus]